MKPEEKPKEDKGLFLQLPFILIDTVSMSDSAMVGFIRFCREHLQKDKTINYHGSYRLLARDIKQPRSTCYRSVENWVKSGLIVMTETADEFILTCDLSPLWNKNSDHCKAQQRPKSGQRTISAASQIGTQVTSTASQNKHSSVPNINGTIPNRDDSVPNWDTNERKTAPIDTIDTLIDTSNREKGNFAIAPSPCALSFIELDVDCEDLPEAQSKQAIFAYSHEKPATDLPEKSIETVTPPASVGYMQESKPVSPPEKPKRGARKPKVEQATLIDASKKAVAYNEAEQRVFDWYCGCDFIHAKPEQDANRKKHCGTLAQFVHSQEEMQHLANFTKQRIKEQFKQEVYIVQMGNMANSDNLNAWIASRKKVQRTQEVEKPAEPIILMDEKTKRNAERSKQVLIDKFQERMDKKGKFQAFEVVHMVERLGMEVAPYLMEQYNALQQVAVSR